MYSILYIDDEPDLLDIAKIFFAQDKRFHVDTITSAEAALRLLDTGNYDAIVSDYRMPGMDGIQFLQHIRSSGDSIPFIMFTGKGSEESMTRALHEGADYYILKDGDPGMHFADLTLKILTAVNQRKRGTPCGENEAWYRTAISSMSEGVLLNGRDGKVMMCNPASLRILGLTEDQLVGTSGFDPSWRTIRENGSPFPVEMHPGRQVQQTGVPQSGVIMGIRKPDGPLVWISINAVPVFGPGDPVPSSVIISFTDITGKKQVEQELRSSEEKYRTLSGSMSSGVFYRMADGSVMDVNPAALRMSGLTSRQFTGMDPHDPGWKFVAEDGSVVPAEQRPSMVALKTGKPVRNTIYGVYHPERDDYTWLTVHAEPQFRTGEEIPYCAYITMDDITGIKRAEKALTEREELFRSVVYNSSDLTVLTDNDGINTYLSPQCEQVTGHPPEKFMGKIFPDIIHPDDIARCRETWEQVALQGKKIHDYEYRIFDARGTVRWVSHSATLNKVNGRVLGLQSTIRDITERKRAEEKLQESEEKYRVVIENADEAIMVIQDGMIVFGNPRAAEIIKTSPQEMITQPIIGFIHPDDRFMVSDWILKRLDGEPVSMNYDIRLVIRQDPVIWVRISVVRINWKGRPATLSFITDITRQKTAEEELQKAYAGLEDRIRERTADLYVANMKLQAEIEKRKAASSALHESEEKFRKIFEALDDVYYRVDMQGLITDISPSCKKLLGWTMDELIGTPFENLYSMPEQRKVFFTVIEENGAVYDYEIPMKRQDGRPVLFSINAHLLNDKNGNQVAIEGTFRDITERKQLEEKHQKLNDELSATIHAIPDLMFETDREGRFLNYHAPDNEALFARPEVFLGKTMKEVLPPETVSIIQEAIDKAALESWHKGAVYSLPLPGGERWFELSISAKGDTRSPDVRFIIMARDITERKQAEDALEKLATRKSILNDLIATANKAESLGEIASKAADTILSLLDYDACGIYLLDADNKTTTIVYSKNIPPAFLEEVKVMSASEPPYNILFSEGRPIMTVNYDELDAELSKLSGFLSLAGIPIVSRGKTIGSFIIACRRRNDISGNDKEVLLSIGRELGSTIDRLLAYRESENAANNLMTLFNSIEEMVFVLDMEGRVITVNNTVKNRLLYTDEELAGRDVIVLHEPEQRDEVLRNFQELVQGTSDSCPLPLVAKDGTLIEVETVVTKGAWNNQEVLIGVSRDITERRKGEQALRESEEQLALAIEGSGAGLWDWNVKTGETVFNQRWAEIIGYTLEELQPVSIATWTAFTHPEDLERSNKLLMQHFSGELQEYECEVRMKHRNGDFVWVLDRGRVTRWDSDGRPLRMTGTHLDITRRKQLEMELEFHERELIQHSAQLYHEVAVRRQMEEEISKLNQELETKVRIRTNELDETVRKLQEEIYERKQVEVMMELTSHKLTLMNDAVYQDIQNKITALRGFSTMLQNTQSEEKRLELYRKEDEILKTIHILISKTKDYQKMGCEKHQWFDLAALIRGTKLPHESPVTMDTDLQGISIYTDPLITRVFDIMIENSVRHGEKVTRIRFSCKKATEGIVLICEDDGVGIPAGEKQRIFERVVSGGGKFGLFFVQQLLSLSGMTITETGEPGKGARFEITIPKGVYRVAG